MWRSQQDYNVTYMQFHAEASYITLNYRRER